MSEPLIERLHRASAGAVTLETSELLREAADALALALQQRDALQDQLTEAIAQLIALRAQQQALIEEWRQNVLTIGPYLEGAAFSQCADQLATLSILTEQPK